VSNGQAARTRDSAIHDAVVGLRTEMTAALQALVRIPSQTGAEGAAQEAMARLMREQGLEVDVWEPDAAALAPYAEFITLDAGFTGRPNVVGVRRGAGSGRSLILNGHIDTVEVGDPEAWTTPPLQGTAAGGRLYGRGACDMKGGLIANLFALVALERARYVPAGDVILESTISEEDGGSGALAAVLRGYVADAALISEPTDLAIVPAHGGSLMFRLRVPGLSAHGATRDEGVSALENFAALHHGLLAFEARRNREIAHPLYAGMRNKVPINIGTLRGGSWPSSVPEWAVAEGRAGLVPGEDLQTFKAQFAAEVQSLAAADPWLREHPPLIEWLPGQFAPSEIPLDAPLLTTLAAAVEIGTGAPPRIEAVPYGADMRHFVLAGGMPCVMFGAGSARVAHAPDEFIPLAELERAVETVAIFIADWCGAVARD
jgi:acetylornithine deacetylase